MGVVKNIIPAIASTNALVSGACVNEAVKVGTYCNKNVDNYMMYMGQTGIYCNTFNYERNPDCIVCGTKRYKKTVKLDQTLQSLIDDLKEELKLNKPQLGGAKGILYIPSPPALEEKSRPNLELTLQQLMDEGKIVAG